MDIQAVILVCLAFAAGGIVKGATGAGAPLFAVPLMAMQRDIQFAVAVFVLANIVPNLWQFLQYRRALEAPRFAVFFAAAGGVGVGLGTVALAGWEPDLLVFGVGLVLAAYVVFRLLNPRWRLTMAAGWRAVVPAGLVAGVLQGATGLSAPVSITFLNALDLKRETFIATISLFFVTLGVVQLPAQFALGVTNPHLVLLSALALIPLMLGMPVGAWLGRRLPQVMFQRAVLVILAVLAVRLIYSGIA
ncbi:MULTISPECIES: sulfite exporter TauE/SafE family protein [Maritimibacter]|uniref:sulfite exporter TauE/SafE family protein n=1 Tax=Maritimibacter TaxID=404235 RepID=UPI001109B000|nr:MULTISPECIES: sulfite exporter TauE/SafE family protein [Maritimibacter]MBL6429790.1 sulfite exporter TauE/SafE family protein [Maritimibacter sp.]